MTMNKMILMAGAALSLAAFGAEKPLTRETAEIVVEPEVACGAVAYAADELGKYLGKSLGGAIPCVTNPTPGKVSIVLGEGALARDAGVLAKKPGYDGYRIRTAPGRIYIAGHDDPMHDLKRVMATPATGGIDYHEHGTLFGVYEFLERFAGVRFYFPHELGVIVPRRDAIAVPPTDLVDAPANFVRRLSGWGQNNYWLDAKQDSPDWVRARGLTLLRNRMATASIPCCHGQNGFCYVERFAKTHPEYLRMKEDGTRVTELLDENGNESYRVRHLCHTSKVWDEMYEDVKAYLTGQSAESRGIPNHLSWKKGKYGWNYNCQEGRYVDVMTHDGLLKCSCPNCQKAYQDKPEWATDLIWGNTKRLAEKLIAEKIPGYITQMSYTPYRDLPDFDLPTNILVMVAENGPWSVRNPKLFARDRDRIKAWAKKLKGKVWIWTYPGKWGRFARENVPAMAPRAYGQFYQSVADSIFGAYAESETEQAFHNYLNHYILGRVLWNPSVDVDAILDEHYRLMFGAAAPEMKAFYEGLEDKWVGEMVVQDNVGTSFYTMPNDVVQWTKIYSPAVLRAWTELFEKGAAKLAAGSDEAKRLAFVRARLLEPLKAEAEKFLGGVKRELAARQGRPNTSILENGDIAGREKWVGKFEFDPSETVTGKGSLRLTTPSNRVSCVQMLGTKLKPDTTYRISYFMKQTALEPKGAAYAILTDWGANSRSRTWQSHPYIAPREAHDWLFRSYEVHTGSKPLAPGKQSSFGFFLDGPGTAWFDGVRVEPVGSPAPAGRGLKVLMVGNSFSLSNIRQMPQICRDMGLGLELGSLYIGGCSLERHWNNVVAATNADFRPYQYDLFRNGARVKEAPARVNIPEIVQGTKWDVITLQQASPLSWQAKSYDPYFNQLYLQLKKWCPGAEIVVQETWSYTPYDGRLAKWNMNPAQMYEKLRSAYCDWAGSNGLRIIPMGAAVQLWRERLPVKYAENSFGGDVCGNMQDGKIGDCSHLNARGEYFQSLVWTAKLFGADVTKCTYRPDFVSESEAAKMKEIARAAVNGERPSRVTSSRTSAGARHISRR